MELDGFGLDTGFCWGFRGLSRERATATAVDRFFQLGSLVSCSIKARAGWGRLAFPPCRGCGGPGRAKARARTRTTAKYRDLSTARWTVRLSSASVEMTFCCGAGENKQQEKQKQIPTGWQTKEQATSTAPAKRTSK